MTAPKILMVYYSRGGNTRRVAETLSDQLGCDFEEITVEGARGGLIGYLICGVEAVGVVTSPINKMRLDPSAYDLVIVGTPTWGFKVSSPVRTYLTENREKFPKIALFCTKDSVKANATTSMAEIVGKEPVARASIRSAEIKDGSYLEIVGVFVSEIKRAL